MDKQKQIEEMAKYICGYVQSKELDSLKLISCKSGNPLFLGVSHNYGVAEYLYNVGYRKIPEGAVVLTREELEEILVNYVPQSCIDEICKEIIGEKV